MRKPPPIHGISAPQPRLTALGAALLALAVAIPGGVLIGLIARLVALF